MSWLKKSALFLVVANPLPQDVGSIGYWNGSTAVPIARNWAITAKHTGGGVGSDLVLEGATRTVLETISQPDIGQDLMLIRFQQPVTIWYEIKSTLKVGDPIMMGGNGRTAVPGGPWEFPLDERWGTNKLSSDSLWLAATYDAPTSNNATPNECMVALNDSGGGFFSVENGKPKYLEGLIASLYGQRYGYATYGDVAYAYKLDPHKAWIYSKIPAENLLHYAVSDFDQNGVVSIDDLFKYLNAWFSKDLRCDIDKNLVVDLNDFFKFLNLWYSAK